MTITKIPTERFSVVSTKSFADVIASDRSSHRPSQPRPTPSSNRRRQDLSRSGRDGRQSHRPHRSHGIHAIRYGCRHQQRKTSPSTKQYSIPHRQSRNDEKDGRTRRRRRLLRSHHRTHRRAPRWSPPLLRSHLHLARPLRKRHSLSSRNRARSKRRDNPHQRSRMRG